MTTVRRKPVQLDVTAAIKRVLWAASFVVMLISRAGLASPKKKFEVYWSSPKLVQLKSKKHGRFELNGKTKPGTKIQIQSGAVWIDSQNKTGDLPIEKMSPSAKELTVGASGRFKIMLTLPFKHVDIPFQAIWNGYRRNYVLAMLAKNQPKSQEWNFGLEARSVTYSQTGKSTLRETMLAADISYRIKMATSWSFVAQSFIDLAGETPFSVSQNEMSAQFWGLNSDLVYSLPLRQSGWSVGIVGGFYFVTMLPSQPNFGFSDLWGPELYPVFTYAANRENSFDFYLKYAPVYTQSSLSFSSHEAKAGVAWIKQNADNHTFSLKLELLQDVFIESGNSGTATAINFGLSYGVP